jgi:hypothetical protein
MTQHNGYVNQPSHQLYDTTGTTEDWSYYATGGLGFTVEIGEEFHPPYERVVTHYVGGTAGEDRGSGPFVDRGNREAYFEALASTADPALHSVLHGAAPAGAHLTLTKSFPTLTSPVVDVAGGVGPRQAFVDTLQTSTTVGPDGTVEWHVNPSTRPAVMERRLEVLDSPTRSQTFEGGATLPVAGVEEHEFQVLPDEPAALLQVDLTWPTPDDLDLEVHYRHADGSLEQVASSGAFVGEKEQAFVDAPRAGTYVLRVVNFASVSPSYTLTASLFDAPGVDVTPGLVEQWTLICSVDGAERSRQLVTVDRGQQTALDLAACGGEPNGGREAKNSKK